MTLQGHWTARGVTDQFERFAFFLAVSFASYRLLFALFAPKAWHIPDGFLLSVMLGLATYLWIAQSQAASRLAKSEAALRQAQIGVLAALVAAMEAKDEYTRGHSEQVRRLSVELGKRLALDEARLEVLSRAAVLHDLGKIETPDAILHKKEVLTDGEWQILRKHPARTATILSSLEFLGEEIRLAALHHERWDGAGYGVGLKGQDIPIESSILAVTDTFDAMNSDRPYRTRLPREKILGELEKSRGVQHPAAVVDAFVKLLQERPELWIRP